MEVEFLEKEKEIGPSLGRVLSPSLRFHLLYESDCDHHVGIMSIIIIAFYCLGMGFKLYKIWKGEYVEEEPVFLKYK